MDEKKADSTGLLDGVHKNAQGPTEEASGTPLGVLNGSTRGNDDKEQTQTPPPKVREPHELQDEAWRLMDEAVRTGRMKLEDDTIITLNADSLIRVIQWLASAKAKKPHLLSTPEDFNLKETTSG